jgi:hypothetical protein
MPTYGIENWALNRSERREIETEISSLRRMSGCALTDYLRNKTMRILSKLYALKLSLCLSN